MFVDIAIIICLILLNGFFSMSELAVVSARKPRLSVMAEAGNRGAAVALALANDPGKFLSSIQIGITLIGILSGAYSGATLAEPFGNYLSDTLQLGSYSNDMAIGLVVIMVTYLSLVIGELVPKQLALQNAEKIACAVARPMQLLALGAKPVVWFLECSNQLIIRLLKVKQGAESAVSEEEVKAVIAEGTESGVLEPEERQMLERVMKLDDIGISAAMTHRKDIIWLDVNEATESMLQKIQTTQHTRYLLCDKSIEHVVGIVAVKDLVLHIGKQQQIDLRKISSVPVYLPESATILEVLEEFKQSVSNMAVIVDEYGVLQGIVTLKDLLEAIVGTLPEPAHREDYTAIQRQDGSWLVDAGLSVHEAEELIGISGLSQDEAYATVAGFVLHELRNIPKAGDRFEWRNWRIEVMDMDGNRVDKVLMQEV